MKKKKVKEKKTIRIVEDKNSPIIVGKRRRFNLKNKKHREFLFGNKKSK